MKLKRRVCLCLICGLALVAFLLLRSTVEEREASEYQRDSLRRAVGVHVGLQQVPDVAPMVTLNAKTSELGELFAVVLLTVGVT